MDKIRPIRNRVLINKVEDKEQIKDRIIIPDEVKEAAQEAIIVAL